MPEAGAASAPARPRLSRLTRRLGVRLSVASPRGVRSQDSGGASEPSPGFGLRRAAPTRTSRKSFTVHCRCRTRPTRARTHCRHSWPAGVDCTLPVPALPALPGLAEPRRGSAASVKPLFLSLIPHTRSHDFILDQSRLALALDTSSRRDLLAARHFYRGSSSRFATRHSIAVKHSSNVRGTKIRFIAISSSDNSNSNGDRGRITNVTGFENRAAGSTTIPISPEISPLTRYSLRAAPAPVVVDSWNHFHAVLLNAGGGHKGRRHVLASGSLP